MLATLQREARLVDLIHEDLSQYSDAQVGAAARPCLQQCGGVLDRFDAMLFVMPKPHQAGFWMNRENRT